jgi:dTDP-4-amino-4,6-dideoxygalactose transaminase
VAVSNGSAALEAAVAALGLGKGDEVILPSSTIISCAAPIVRAGAKPVLVDCDPRTWNMDAAQIEARITPRTKAVMVVHIFGLPVDMGPVIALALRHGLKVIEDAAEVIGQTYRGRPCGSFGDLSTFSFYPNKHVTTGEGGMIVTADERIRDEAHIYRDQGKAGFLGGDHVRMGYAWRMSELQAAVGIVQLRRLDEFIKIRREVADLYDDGLAGIDGITPLTTPSETNYYKYLAMLDAGIDRQAVKSALKENHGVSLTGEVYASPLHEQPVFAGLHEGSLPVAEDVCRRHVCLPIHSDMTRDEAEYVIASVRTVLAEVGSKNGTS